jgi:hypothetical protein
MWYTKTVFEIPVVLVCGVGQERNLPRNWFGGTKLKFNENILKLL